MHRSECSRSGHAFGIQGIGTDPVTGTTTPNGIPEMAVRKGENRGVTAGITAPSGPFLRFFTSSVARPAYVRGRHGAIMTRVCEPGDYGRIGGHAHEIALPLTQRGAPAPTEMPERLVPAAGHSQLRLAAHLAWLSATATSQPGAPA
jgi:hypothetical protein